MIPLRPSYTRLRPKPLLQAFTHILYPSPPPLPHRTSCSPLTPSPFLSSRPSISSRSATTLTSKTPPHATLDLPKQPETSTLSAFIKQAAANGAVRKLFHALQQAEQTNQPPPNPLEYRLAIRALIKAQRADLAIQLYQQRISARKLRHELDTDPGLAVAVLRAVLKHSKKRKQKAEDSDLVFRDLLQDAHSHNTDSEIFVAMLDAVLLFLTHDDVDRAMHALKALSAMKTGHIQVQVARFNDAIRLLGKKRRLEAVFTVLQLMRATASQPNNETYEFLANAAVRQVEFVTGAVSMDTLPHPIATEVAFVGRSNVGKSSLLNMICNRKALAYVSGRPGKTQQFNYFLVNGKDENKFYMVDLPGVGYAKVPKHIQQEWRSFMRQYLMHRTSLNMVFHLVDGRHGALQDDEDLMSEIAAARRTNGYVVVLTKMDKMNKQKAKQSVLDKTRAALSRNGCPEDTPIVLTSASTKLGREEMWRFMQAALIQ